VSEYNERGAKTEQMGSDGTNFLSLLIGMEGSNSLIGEGERKKSNVKSSLYISRKQTNSTVGEGERKRRERKIM
jgi:hypothetical protein